MQHGERGAHLPRQQAKAHGRKVCNAHNAEARRRWPGGTLFTVGQADMNKVTVETIRRKRPRKKD